MANLPLNTRRPSPIPRKPAFPLLAMKFQNTLRLKSSESPSPSQDFPASATSCRPKNHSLTIPATLEGRVSSCPVLLQIASREATTSQPRPQQTTMFSEWISISATWKATRGAYRPRRSVTLQFGHACQSADQQLWLPESIHSAPLPRQNDAAEYPNEIYPSNPDPPCNPLGRDGDSRV